MGGLGSHWSSRDDDDMEAFGGYEAFMAMLRKKENEKNREEVIQLADKVEIHAVMAKDTGKKLRFDGHLLGIDSVHYIDKMLPEFKGAAKIKVTIEVEE